MDFLPLLYKCVVLCDSLQGQLLHEVDLIGFPEVLFHELLHAQREGGRKQQDLAFFG